MRKGGISAVVATVLIILITIAGVTLIWQMVVPMIKDNLDFSALEGRIEIVTSEGFTFYDAVEKKASVQVRRGMDDESIDRINIIFYINGNSFKKSVDAPAPGNTKTHIFDLAEYGIPSSVSVVPIFIIGNKEKEGDATFSVKIMKKGKDILLDFEDLDLDLDLGGDEGGDSDGDVDVDSVARSCSDLFAMGYDTDGTYEIDPDGSNVGLEPFEVYCDMVENEIELWVSDAEDGDASEWLGSVEIDSENTYEGDYSFVRYGPGKVYAFDSSTDFIPIDTTKSYRLEGWFKSGGTEESSLYFGFISYDQDKKFISYGSVTVHPDSETTLYEECSFDDKIIKIVDGSNWKAWERGAVAFDVDDSGNYNDLPNRKLSFRDIVRVEDKGDYWEVEFNKSVGQTYPAGTKVREHNEIGSFLYIAAEKSFVPNTWTEYKANIFGELPVEGSNEKKWKKGTKYVKIVVISNYRQAESTKMYYDNIKLIRNDIPDGV